MVGCTGTSGVRRKGTVIVDSRAKAMPYSRWAKAIRYYTREVGDPSTDRLGCKGSATEGDTEAEEQKGRDPMTETATNDWIPETGRPKEGTIGDAPGA